MPRIYQYAATTAEWRAVGLTGPLGLLPPAPGVTVVPCATGGAALIAGPDSVVAVNGRGVPWGLRVLGERDEIRVAAERWYFSRHDPLVVESYGGEPSPCPRCGGVIQHGSAAIRCHCGAWFHQSEERACFTYGDSCPLCAASAQLETDPWDPSGL